MKFTEEQIIKAKSAKSAEELLAIAKVSGVELTEDEVKKYFAELHREGELSDDDLSLVNAAGEPEIGTNPGGSTQVGGLAGDCKNESYVCGFNTGGITGDFIGNYVKSSDSE